MFWRFGGYQSIPTINSVLDKPNVTVEEVLDEADLLQELKENNTKLIEYLRDDDVLKRLLDYIVSASLLPEDEFDDDEEDEDAGGGNQSVAEAKESAGDQASPPSVVEDDNQKTSPTRTSGVSLSPERTQEELEEAERVRLKYAYMASEVLSAPTWSVIEAMTLHESALRDFWHFLWGKSPLSAVQTNYFVKVNEVLLDKKPVEMISFIMSLDGVVDEMLRHVDNPLVMDLLLKIISLDRVNGTLGVAEWLHSHNLIPVLLSYLSPDYTASTQTSAGEFLKALITISANAALNEQPCIGPNSLTRQLVSESCVQTLISCVLQGGNPLTVAVGVVIEIIRKNNPDYDPESVGTRDSPPTMHDPIYLGTLLHMFASHIPDFMELLLGSKPAETKDAGYKRVQRVPLSTAWGEKIESLGFDRFKVCELMAELLHCSNMGLHNEEGSHEFMTQRDAERERLRKQGVFVHAEDGSSYVYADSSNDAINGASPSFFGSGSPDESRRFDNTHHGDDDGFEDVSSAEVFDEKHKDEAERPGHADSSQSGTGDFTRVSKLGMDDDFVDEPLTPPTSDDVSSADDPTEDSGLQTPKAENAEPISPTTGALAEKVDDFKITSADQSQTENERSTGVTHTTDSTGTENHSQSSTTEQEPGSTGDEISQQTPTADTAAPAAPAFDAQDIRQQDENTPGSDDVKTSITSLGEASTQRIGSVGPVDEESEAANWPVGDYLKIMFYRHKVVPTIFSFFFRFPWNNFLHHVVYDVVQQVLNGPTDKGFNRTLIVDLFETGDITAKIVEGQRRSEEAEAARKMRMGYMGHLTLIAEEVVRFTERQSPEELAPTVMDRVLHPDWVSYVERTLSETRERESAILGGVKPDLTMCHRQAVLNAINNQQDFSGSSALANAGLNGGMANSAFEGFDLMNQGTASGGAFGLSSFGAGGTSLLSGFGGSSDDEDEDMDDPEEDSNAKGLQLMGAEGSNSDNANTTNDEMIPVIPPPAPLSTGPSRARRQLAARLARRKEANDSNNAKDGDGEEQGNNPGGDPNDPVPPFSDPHGEFVSSTSSDEDQPGSSNISHYPPRYFEMDDFDGDDMGDLVSPTTGDFMSPYDDVDDGDVDDDGGIIHDSLRYSNTRGYAQYTNTPKGPADLDKLLVESDERGNSSDEDDKLVEISVSGKK